MTWKERLIGIPLAVLGALLLLATGLGMVVTRTDRGREVLRAFALEKLNGAIQGRVEIDEVLEGDLLRMIRMAGVRIYEPDGREFARIDTLSVHYRWSDFLVGGVTLAKVTLVRPVVNLRVSGDGRWNFQEVFGRRTPRPPVAAPRPGHGRGITLREVAIRSGDLTLRLPWRPDPAVPPDSSRWHLERTADGWQRVIRLERLSAILPKARVAAPAPLGWLFQVARLSSRATIIGEPFELRQLRADIETRADTLSFQVWEAELPGSKLLGEGWVTLSGQPEYDLTLSGNPVATADLAWLLPALPPATARLDFRFRRFDDGFSLEARNARWESPLAELRGRFAMVSRAGHLRFDDVDLEIRRLHTKQIGSLTGWEAPAAAVLAGRVKLDGPLSRLELDAALRVALEGDGPPSRIEGAGVVHLERGGLGAEDLRLRFDTLRLELARAFVPGLELRGGLIGSARLDGLLGERLAFDFRLEQRDRGRTPLRLGGGGTTRARPGEPIELDVEIVGDSLSLTALADYYPAVPFRGDFRPSVRAVGTLDDLEVRALLKGVDDSLRVDGRLSLAGGPLRYRGEVRGWRMRLPEFRPGLPASDLDFRVVFEGRGTALAELEGRAQAKLFPSFVGGVGFDSAAVTLRASGGRLVVDSSAVAGEFGRLEAVGAFPLLPEGADSLWFALAADSLGAFNPWLLPTTEVLTASTLTADAATAGGVAGSRIEGSAVVRGWLIRDGDGLLVRGEAGGRGLSYGGLAAGALEVEGLEVGRVDTASEPAASWPPPGSAGARTPSTRWPCWSSIGTR
jgi:hypothetical protein